MTVERRSIGRDVMGDELTKDRPAGGDTAERGRCIGEIAAVAQSPRATERVKERLVGCERREVRKHTRISGGPECGINRPANPRRRQAMRHSMTKPRRNPVATASARFAASSFS